MKKPYIVILTILLSIMVSNGQETLDGVIPDTETFIPNVIGRDVVGLNSTISFEARPNNFYYYEYQLFDGRDIDAIGASVLYSYDQTILSVTFTGKSTNSWGRFRVRELTDDLPVVICHNGELNKEENFIQTEPHYSSWSIVLLVKDARKHMEHGDHPLPCGTYR